jgi:hypothetical protein
MDDLFRGNPSGFSPDPERTEHLDPLLSRRVETRPWQLRAAQWRAVELAELAFGEGVVGELAGRGGFSPFRGLLTLTVPFQELADHRRKEEVFLSWALRDPILTQVPFVFLFRPEPVGAT